MKIRVIILLATIASFCMANNLTEWRNLRRQKRSLIYLNAAQVKFVAGISFPVRLEDPVPYRQITTTYNLQAQYPLPLLPKNLYTIFNGRSLIKYKQEFDKFGSYKYDQSRNFVYVLLEIYLNKTEGVNGRICLKRAICDNAHLNRIDGVFAEILHTVLTPVKNNSDSEYVEAYEAGKFGADCLTLFPDCPKGKSFFDIIFVGI